MDRKFRPRSIDEVGAMWGSRYEEKDEERMGILILLLVGLLVFLPEGRAENWKVVWKDDMQELRVDRDSVRIDGAEVDYWYSDSVDAIVDFMEHHYHVVSDCATNRMRHLEVYDPASGRTNTVQDAGWKDMPYNPRDSVTVMHYEICRDYQ